MSVNFRFVSRSHFRIAFNNSHGALSAAQTNFLPTLFSHLFLFSYLFFSTLLRALPLQLGPLHRHVDVESSRANFYLDCVRYLFVKQKPKRQKRNTEKRRKRRGKGKKRLLFLLPFYTNQESSLVPFDLFVLCFVVDEIPSSLAHNASATRAQL